MPKLQLDAILQHIRRSAFKKQAQASGDRQLLESFVARRGGSVIKLGRSLLCTVLAQHWQLSSNKRRYGPGLKLAQGTFDPCQYEPLHDPTTSCC